MRLATSRARKSRVEFIRRGAACVLLTVESIQLVKRHCSHGTLQAAACHEDRGDGLNLCVHPEGQAGNSG